MTSEDHNRKSPVMLADIWPELCRKKAKEGGSTAIDVGLERLTELHWSAEKARLAKGSRSDAVSRPQRRGDALRLRKTSEGGQGARDENRNQACPRKTRSDSAIVHTIRNHFSWDKGTRFGNPLSTTGLCGAFAISHATAIIVLLTSPTLFMSR